MAKSIVLYYSQTQTTKKVAEEIARLTSSDIEAIDVKEPYNGSYDETVKRCMAEMNENILPHMKPLKSDLSKYGTIFLGFPVWFGTYAQPIAALVKEYGFDGKTIVPFCTFGSGGRVSSRKALQASLPNAKVEESYGVRDVRVDKAPAEIKRFLIEGGYIEGKVEALPEYSAQHPVTDEEVKIFDAACAGYPFPLGTPLTAGTRETAKSMDYKFAVKNKDMQGNDVNGIIFITEEKTPSAKPEFTEVIM